jgi:CarD family transcriptional regulator
LSTASTASSDFAIGDKAVYPSQGVAEVVGIEQKEISGKIQRFYVLRVLESDNRIMVPTDKSGQVGLRRIAGEEEIDEVRQILRDKEVHVDRQTWNRRYRGFMEKIRSGSLFEVAEVFRDLYRLKGLKPLSFGERRMLDTARGLVVQELSVAQAEDEHKVEQELNLLLQ